MSTKENLRPGDDPDDGFDKGGRSRKVPFGKGNERSLYSEQLAALHAVVDLRGSSASVGHEASSTERLAARVIRAEEQWGLLPESLSVSSGDTPIGFGGYDRPNEWVENVDEVIGRYQANSDPEMFCGWCELTRAASASEKASDEGLPDEWIDTEPRVERFRSKSLDKAIHWFAHHTCTQILKPEYEALWLRQEQEAA